MDAPYEQFGSMVFGEKEMQDRLPRPIYLKWKETIASEGTLDRQTADAIAHAMKRWALEKGVTHFTHWFQPMRGSTAEKHFAFIEPDENGIPFTHLSGKMLIKGEQDASSFPNGGLRATFEARGYTYWDVSSPVFIKDNILCIPSIFISYNGDSLDMKDPLLKSIKAIDLAATNIIHLLGEKDVRHCTPMCGLEQEYFLIDRAYFDKRPDLEFSGRTLIGAPSPKGQELNDHYSGSIPTRVRAFMKDLNEELWKLGIYANTEHNEVAPGQFELAVIYNACNIHVDQNTVSMDIMRGLAEKHGLAILFYEKPFAGINGSGKHDNYSIVTDTGSNIFTPGEKPAENIRFLVFVCAFLKAVDDYAKLLRVGASCIGNDERLGATEAPPAIISIYLGDYIESVLMNLAETSTHQPVYNELPSSFGPVAGLSYIPRDNTDRNRTSPIAFTGNKFEFRMVGSSMSGALPNTILNAILAKTLNDLSKQLEGIKYVQDVRAKALKMCSELIRKHKRILYSGDGYSEEWVTEAKKRGLPNIRSYIDSLDILDEKETVELFKELNIYNAQELGARKAVFAQQYRSTIGIDVKTLLNMERQQLFPAMKTELEENARIYSELKDLTQSSIISHIKEIQFILETLNEKCNLLEHSFQKISEESDLMNAGHQIYETICPLMAEIRSLTDHYEQIAAKKNYPFPTYAEMLFRI